MPILQISYATDAERLVLERLIAFGTEMCRLADQAPDGGVVAACEGLAVERGRAVLGQTVEQALRARAAAAEGKGGRPGSARAGAGAATRGGESGRW